MSPPGALLALAVLLGAGADQETPLQAAVRLCGEGSPAAALEAARASESPLERAQAELYVLHRAGALDEALDAGLRALEVAPSDPWTLEETAYVALSLGEGALASRLLGRLAPQLDRAGAERTAWMGEEAERLAARRGEEQRALRLGRSVAAAGATLALAVALLASRTPRTPRA